MARLAGDDAWRHRPVARRGKNDDGLPSLRAGAGGRKRGRLSPRGRGVHPCPGRAPGTGARQRPVLRSPARRFALFRKPPLSFLAQPPRRRNHLALDQHAADILNCAGIVIRYRYHPVCSIERTKSEFRKTEPGEFHGCHYPLSRGRYFRRRCRPLHRRHSHRHRNPRPYPTPRPALRRAAFARRRHGRYHPHRRRSETGAQSRRHACRPCASEDLSLWPLRHRCAVPHLRRHDDSGLLHQDRLASLPYLYRPPWPEGQSQGDAGRRYFQGAAILRLGGRTAVAGAARICSFRRALSPCAAREADAAASARWAYGLCRRLLRFPPDPRQARPSWLGRGRYFRAQLTLRVQDEIDRPVPHKWHRPFHLAIC
ncbi:hypothetical protein RHSP_22821 [Rhizobium freirei PRF 81]|uniref:Uncharacterized protein n=1 Tax=Rhizobium freirei PRF 81 TaxID=363754 RepID=N6TVC0_9HYPH|nr:hypothetical protein RHSP_22821 [Rhizobium freirei PRF 81]